MTRYYKERSTLMLSVKLHANCEQQDLFSLLWRECNAWRSRVTSCAEGRDAEIFRALSPVKSPLSTLSPKLSHFHWTGKICDLLTSKRKGCYTNTEITRLHVCVLYRSESPFINLHLSWTCPSDPFIKAGAIRMGDLAIWEIEN